MIVSRIRPAKDTPESGVPHTRVEAVKKPPCRILARFWRGQKCIPGIENGSASF